MKFWSYSAEGVCLCLASFLMLLVSILFYFKAGFNNYFGVFPFQEVWPGVFLSLVVYPWCIRVDPKKYKNIFVFVGCSTFMTVAITTAIIFGKISNLHP